MLFALLASLAATTFDYDAAQPLDVQEKLFRERSTHRVLDVTYASPKGGRVTAYLVIPKLPRGKRAAGMVFGHWGPGNRTEFLPEAEIYAQANVVSILIDYPWTRPAPWRRDADDVQEPEKSRELQIQAVVDLRRAIDLLAARGDVDPQRIGYVGHSYGAQWGAILSAIENRLRTCVLIGGTPDFGALFDAPDAVRAEYVQANRAKIDRARTVLADMAGIRYVPESRVPLLFQFATIETYFDEAAMKRYSAAAREPKSVLWYDAGHDLNGITTLRDRARWLESKVPAPGLVKAIQAVERR